MTAEGAAFIVHTATVSNFLTCGSLNNKHKLGFKIHYATIDVHQKFEFEMRLRETYLSLRKMQETAHNNGKNNEYDEFHGWTAIFLIMTGVENVSAFILIWKKYAIMALLISVRNYVRQT